jgi:hypothetical protein
MNPRHLKRVAFFCLALLGTCAWAQHRRDPLNSAEVDELRDTALEADKRLKLYVKFARARLETLEQMRADPKTTDRAKQTRDDLQDFLDVYDELNDNIDNFADRKEDLRKVMPLVIEADTEFDAKIRALQSPANSSKSEMEVYRTVLANAVESLELGTKDHRDLLAQQQKDPTSYKKK